MYPLEFLVRSHAGRAGVWRAVALLGRRAGHNPSACARAASRACVCVGYADGRVQLVPSHPVLHAGEVLERVLPPPAPTRQHQPRSPQSPTPEKERSSPSPPSAPPSTSASAGNETPSRQRNGRAPDADADIEADAHAESALATAEEATQLPGPLTSRVRVRGALRLGDGPVSALRFLFDDSFVLAALHNSRSLFLLRVHDT